MKVWLKKQLSPFENKILWIASIILKHFLNNDIIQSNIHLWLFFFSFSLIWSTISGIYKNILFIWLLLLDWWPGIWGDGVIPNICCSGYYWDWGNRLFFEIMNSSKVDLISTFFLTLSDLILFDPSLRRCSVFPFLAIYWIIRSVR